jgi:hypothetical protein
MLSQIAINKLKLDMSYSMLLSMGISSVLLSFDPTIISKGITQYRIYMTMVTVVLGYVTILIYKYMNKPVKIKSVQYKSLKIYRSSECGIIRFMMETHPGFYSRDYDMEVANPKFETMGNYYIAEIGKKIFFNDTKFNAKGYLRYEEEKVQIGSGDKTRDQAVRCMVIYLEKKCTMQCDEYIKKMEKYRDTIMYDSDEMTLWSVKVMAKSSKNDEDNRRSDYNHYVQMYKGPKKNHEERYQKWFGSYFSPHKAYLWEYMSNIHYHPERFHKFGQGARCNLLLHGPPGTGKSTFVYRLAMSLGRHIVSLDLTALGDDRTKIYQVIQSPRIKDYTMTPDKYIILLEEFDIAVTHLKEKNKRPDFTHMYSKWTSAAVSESKGSSDNDTGFTYSRSTREFELEDLLEILQGPVPLEGAMVIATTNKYDEIKQVCPALFRPGRLTPIEFGYLDWTSLQEMSRHYFQQELTFGPIDSISVSSSEIIEIAMASSFKGEKGFAHFEGKLKKKLSMTS